MLGASRGEARKLSVAGDMRMNRLTVWGGGAVALALAAMLLWPQREPADITAVDMLAHDQRASTSPAGGVDSSPATVAAPAAELAAERMPDAITPDDDNSEDPAKMFRADAAGNLLLGERTRLNIEKISVLYTPEEQQERLAVIERTLPASAYRQLTDLLERYDNLMRDLKQALPPGREASTVEEAITQHESLHALRVAHFGADVAEALYGQEERIGRQLLDFMALERHEGLTMEERAMRAQEMLLRSPELLAAYENNRTAPVQK